MSKWKFRANHSVPFVTFDFLFSLLPFISIFLFDLSLPILSLVYSCVSLDGNSSPPYSLYISPSLPHSSLLPLSSPWFHILPLSPVFSPSHSALLSLCPSTSLILFLSLNCCDAPFIFHFSFLVLSFSFRIVAVRPLSLQASKTFEIIS